MSMTAACSDSNSSSSCKRSSKQALPTTTVPGNSSSDSSRVQQLASQLLQLWRAVVAFVLCSSKRWRFFQLSTDLTTLRWAWNKYILLYYVDSVTADTDKLTITLHMVLDPDLTLAFDDPKTYDQWDSGLQLLLHMLTGAAPGAVFCGPKGDGSAAGFSFQDSNTQGSAAAGYNLGCAAHAACEDVPGLQSATAAAPLSQHSLIMTALNAQFGFEGALGAQRQGGRVSPGLTANQKRNSFLKGSRWALGMRACT